jgi:uncharacterized protein (DUF2141 family)
MSDRVNDQRAQDLMDELWPSPAPPADMAARVLAALARPAHGGSAKIPTKIATKLSIEPDADILGSSSDFAQRVITSITAAAAVGAPTARASARRWPRARALAIGAAAGLLLVSGWWLRRFGGSDTTGNQRGQLIATSAQTVEIGARAAAAAEPGADLTWAVTGKRARVDQRRGSVFYRVNHGGPFRVVTPAGDVEVTGTCFRVQLTGATAGAAATTLVSVLEGTVKVHSDVAERAIGVGQTARLVSGQAPEVFASPSASADQLQSRLASAEARLQQLEEKLRESQRDAAPIHHSRGPATLLLPLSSRLRVFGDPRARLTEVSLAVAPPGDPTDLPVAVEVARDPRFRQAIWRGDVREGFVTVPAPERGDLYWRKVGGDTRAGHARFWPDERPAMGAAGSPHNVVSAERESTTVYFQGAPPALSLTFAAVPGAARYRVRVYRAADLERPIIDQTVSDGRCEISAGALSEGAYVWHALPLDGQGRASGGGRMNKLALAYDNAIDSLALTQLSADPDPKAGSNVEVAGVAPLGARLFVNGKPADLDDKGRFAMHVAGAPRLLVFRVLARDGAESYWVKAVKPRS